MSIIQSIRNNSAIAIGIVALGLVLFLAGDALMSGGSSLFGQDDTIGEINGEEISAVQYNATVERLRNQFMIQNQGQSPDEATMQQIREQAWNQLVFEYAYKPQFDELGIKVTQEEIYDMVQGNYVHPAVRQAFTNPETGQFDKNQIIAFLKNLDSEQMDPYQRAAWQVFENQLPEDRLRTRYENLFTKSVYTPAAAAKREYEQQAAKADVKYLFVPYSSIPDSAVSVTDADLEAYLNENRAKYQGEASRTVTYVAFNTDPSSLDSARVKQELERLKVAFEKAGNDSSFLNLHSEGESDNFATYSIANLPPALQKMSPLQVGKAYGPIKTNEGMALYKVTGQDPNGEEAIKASHILFRLDAGADETAKAELKAKAQGVLEELKAGADFSAMAAQHGSDGTKFQGGDLGWFGKGRMVPAFEKAVFDKGAPGLVPELVETQFGYHIVKVTEPLTRGSYTVASISRKPQAGSETIEEAYRIADEFAAAAGTGAEAFNQAVTQNPALKKAENVQLLKNQTAVNDLQQARELVRWAFNDADLGEVSGVVTAEDKFVVAVLTGKSKKGTSSLDAVRPAVEQAVRNNKKAGVIMEKLSKQNLSAPFEEIGSGYGSEAVVSSAPGIAANAGFISNIGYDPEAVGKVFGLKEGESTQPFEGANGVAIIKLEKTTPASEIADYALYRKQVTDRNKNQVSAKLNNAIRELADVDDNRVRFY